MNSNNNKKPDSKAFLEPLGRSNSAFQMTTPQGQLHLYSLEDSNLCSLVVVPSEPITTPTSSNLEDPESWNLRA
jgi:hypothetical protein